MTRRKRGDPEAKLPTARDYLAGPDLLVCCRAAGCLRSAWADMAAVVAAGHGATPVVRLRWRCGGCGGRDTFAVASGVGPSARWDGRYQP